MPQPNFHMAMNESTAKAAVGICLLVSPGSKDSLDQGKPYVGEYYKHIIQPKAPRYPHAGVYADDEDESDEREQHGDDDGRRRPSPLRVDIVGRGPVLQGGQREKHCWFCFDDGQLPTRRAGDRLGAGS